jgi:hypothetical protein
LHLVSGATLETTRGTRVLQQVSVATAAILIIRAKSAHLQFLGRKAKSLCCGIFIAKFVKKQPLIKKC